MFSSPSSNLHQAKRLAMLHTSEFGEYVRQRRRCDFSVTLGRAGPRAAAEQLITLHECEHWDHSGVKRGLCRLRRPRPLSRAASIAIGSAHSSTRKASR
jgi:hypothetical protein